MNDKLLDKYKAFLEFVKTAQVQSGVCCCGDNMANHPEPMSCGHMAVDQWDYSLKLWCEELENAEKFPS